jgi:hypothetical protein
MLRLAAVLLVLCSSATASAEDHWQRAYKPTCVHRFAKPSNTSKYSGGIVGGGSALRGEGPYSDEGTWGWDYSGMLPIKRIWLDWSHQHPQAGGGKYDTDRRHR